MFRDEILKSIYEYKALIDLFPGRFKASFLAQGEYNVNFLIESGAGKYVLRLNTASQLQLENQIRYEYEALEKLSASGVTPKPIYLDDSLNHFDYGVLLMEFLEGRPLRYESDSSRAIDIFSRIHSLDLDSIDTSNFIVEEGIFSDRIREGEFLLRKVWKSDHVSAEVKSAFEKILDYLEKNRHNEAYFLSNKFHVINNTEVNSSNFIISEDKSYLIDWEKPVISDPCQDMSHLLAPTTTLWKTNFVFDKAEKSVLLAEYSRKMDRKVPDIAERVHQYDPYLYFRALAWCAYAYVEYKNPLKSIQNMDTLEKLELYLEPDFINKLYREHVRL